MMIINSNEILKPNNLMCPNEDCRFHDDEFDPNECFACGYHETVTLCNFYSIDLDKMVTEWFEMIRTKQIDPQTTLSHFIEAEIEYSGQTL